MRLFRVMRRDRDGREHQRQTGEDEGLNDAHQQLQPIDAHRGDEGDQEGRHQDQYLTGGHVAEQPEGEADQPHQFAEALHRPNEEEIHQVLEGVQYLELEQRDYAQLQAPDSNELGDVGHAQHLKAEPLDEDEGH